MKSSVWVTVFTAVSLSFGGLALAQGRDDHRGGGDGRQGASQHDGPRADRGGGRDNRGAQNRRPSRDEHADNRGAGPDHNFYRGGRLPQEYRSRQYVVDDWRGHRLSAPPRGYHWVQTGGDYVLVAIPTGIIFQINFGQ
jgi:Ni/Co efflux regulator RcnB